MPDLSQAEKEVIQRKYERTVQLRAEFLKQAHNPHRHATGEGGTLVSSTVNKWQMLCHHKLFIVIN